MDRKSEFKEFVKKYPSFASYVQNKNTTWQELYELSKKHKIKLRGKINV